MVPVYSFESGLPGDSQQTITTLGGGLELRKPDKHLEGGVSGQAAARDPEVVSHYMELLDEWCSKIRTYLDDRYIASPSDVGLRQ